MMNELALFSGAGGGILAGKLLGWRTVCAVEWEAYQSSALVARQNDGILAPFPIWNDVQTFNGKPWRGIVNVISGGFPCQDISTAGKGAGIEGKRSGMWGHMARIVGEVRPQYVFVENSPMLTSRGLGVVLGDLAEMGYDAQWGCISARDAGAPHSRERIWIVAADSTQIRRWNQNQIQKTSNTESNIWDARPFNDLLDDCKSWNDTERAIDILGDGLGEWVGEIESLGNGQVPIVAATAWQILSERLAND